MKALSWHSRNLGATLVFFCACLRLYAEDLVPPELSPEPSPFSGDRAIESENLETAGQTRALSRTLYAQAVKRELADGFAAALPLYLNVLKVDPQFVDLHIKVALYFMRDRQTGKALEQLQNALSSNPHTGEIEAFIAYVQQGAGRSPEALAAAQAAIIDLPENVLARRIIFESLRDSDHMDQALEQVRQLGQIKSSDPVFWASLAQTFRELICASVRLSRDDLAKLITPLYEKAFALQEPSADLLRQRGDYSLFLGQSAEALDYFKQAGEKGEPNPELYVRIAGLASTLDRRAEALHYYEEAYDLDPDFPQLREVLAFQYVVNNQESKAIDVLEELLRKSPTRSSVYSSLGDLYSQAGTLDKAEFNYRQAINLEPTNPVDYLKLGGLLLQQKRLQEAATVLAEARGRFPASARVAFLEGIVQREKKNFNEALDLFAQAKILAAEKDAPFLNGDFYYELSMTQELAGKVNLSEESLKQGLNLEPNNENLLNALAYLWAEQGKNLVKAAEYSRRSLRIVPDRGEFVDTLGWILFKMQKYQEALPLLEQAATLTNNQADVLGHLAEAYTKLNRRSDAVQALSKLVSAEPENMKARQQLDALMKNPDSAGSDSVKEEK